MPATLSINEILLDTIEALKVEVPLITSISSDFSTETAVKDTTIIAHISRVPEVKDYDAAQGGFRNGAVGAETLLEDLPITLDQLAHVPVKVAYLTQLASKKDLYRDAIRNQAYALGKYVFDAALAKATAANFSNVVVETAQNAMLETLDLKVRSQLNLQCAPTHGRFGIVNSQFAASLQNDPRITSKDYHGQRNGDQGYRVFRNIAGFERVDEYPALSDNGEHLVGFFGTRDAISIATRLPSVQDGAALLGIPSVASFAVETDQETGLSLLGIAWQEPGTFDVYTTIALLFGIAAGKRGGDIGSGCDNRALRVVSQLPE